MGLETVCAIAVMAKAPRPGQVKTRLQTVLDAPEAAAISAAFLRDVTANIQAAANEAPIHGFVAYAPLGQEARFNGLLAPGTQLVLADGSGGAAEGVDGFGCCLLHAIRGLLARGYGAACVLNADSPTLPTAFLAQAARMLLEPGARGVLGPAEDGGYWLLGMQAPRHELFAGIAWSTDTVAAATARQAQDIGLPMHELDAWFDVDDRPSLERLVRDLAAPQVAMPQSGLRQPCHAPFHAPATAACVAALGLPDRLRSASSGI